MKKFFFLGMGVFFFLLAAGSALGAEEAGEATGFWRADPWWFPLLELGGVLVSVFSLFLIQKTMRILGGSLGEHFRLIRYAIYFVIAAFLLRSFFEIREYEGFLYDVLFEIPFYITVILIAFATKKLASALFK